jgi:hypothetical protein
LAEETLFGIDGLTELGWKVRADMERDEWLRHMQSIQTMENASTWALGDGMNAGLMAFGDDAWQGLGLHYEEKTVNRIMACCDEFPIRRRKPKVSVWKAEVMRGLPEEFQDNLMALASEEGLTLDEIRARVDSHEGKDSAESSVLEECPWCGSPSSAWRQSPQLEENRA